MHRKVRFIEKRPSKTVFFLAPPAGLVQTKRLSIVLSNDGAQSASNTRRVYRADVLRHATASGAKRNQRHQLLTVMLTPEKYSRLVRLRLLGFKVILMKHLLTQI